MGVRGHLVNQVLLDKLFQLVMVVVDKYNQDRYNLVLGMLRSYLVDGKHYHMDFDYMNYNVVLDYLVYLFCIV